MNISFEGIGQWAATFSCTEVRKGEMVKVSGNGSVGPCGEGEDFCGQVISMGKGGDACAVQLGGFVTAGYTGSAPVLGWCGLSGDGDGGVKTDAERRKYLVAEVDAVAGTVTFAL
ncbi:MAG: hypothetical protein VB060_11195 [Oscillibacter sp.]|nr:hypothetical protein [Oscillibacter sp.]MEA4994363.1 hypothetical protein [Oscillibacter sp.]